MIFDFQSVPCAYKSNLSNDRGTALFYMRMEEESTCLTVVPKKIFSFKVFYKATDQVAIANERSDTYIEIKGVTNILHARHFEEAIEPYSSFWVNDNLEYELIKTNLTHFKLPRSDQNG